MERKWILLLKILCLGLFLGIRFEALSQSSNSEGDDNDAAAASLQRLADRLDEQEAGTEIEPEPEQEPETKKKRSRSGTVLLEELPPEERIRMQRQMGDIDLYSKKGVPYRKSWGFRSGVTQLYPPYYEGWANGREVKGLYDNFVSEGEAGYTLSSLTYNQRFYKQTGSEFINYYSLVWVPEEYAFTLLRPENFESIKSKVRERIVKARKTYADRDRFDTFQDYIAFKLGRDEEVENFVDGYWIEANESDEHLTYFYTSEFLGVKGKKKEAYKRPLIATATYVIVRNKFLKIDIVKEYDGRDDIARLLDFTNRVREDFYIVNQYGQSDQ